MLEKDFFNPCDECESWQTSILSETEENNGDIKVLIKCHECGSEWYDYREDV